MTASAPRSLRAENERLGAENAELRLRLDEAQQALEAIHTGQVDSLVLEGPDGARIFSLEGPDNAYRMLVEAMSEGAATLAEDGTILYCNARFAALLGAPLERVMGNAIPKFLPEPSQASFAAVVREARGGESRAELNLVGQSGQAVPVYLAVSAMHDDTRRLCVVATDLRAQKRSDEIVAAERLARSVLEQAADAIVVCDEDGRVVRASRSAAELLGEDPLLAPFETALPLVLPAEDEHGPPVSLLAKTMHGETLRAAPASLTRRDGSRVEVLVSAKALHGPGDRTIGHVVTLVDVTEHLRSEEAVRASEERLRLALEAAQQGTWDLDLKTGALGLDERARELFGLAPDAPVTFESFVTTVHTEDRQRMMEVVAGAVRERSDLEVEYRVVRPGGEARWVRVRSRVFGDGRGEPIRMSGIVLDITARKRAEDDLWLGREAYRALADNAPDAVARLDRDARHLYVNAVGAARLGRTPGEVTGKTVRELGVADLEAALWEERVRHVYATGEPQEVEEPFVTPAGARVFHTSLVPERSPSGAVASVLSISRDVTDRKRAEENLRAANLQLADADRRKTEFLAVLSHELRNPLTPIRNSAYILGRAAPGGYQARQALEVIDRQSGQLARLVDDLLNMSRLTQNKIQLRRQSLDLHELVERTVEDHRSLFELAGVTLELGPTPAPVFVNGDWSRLAQVVGNLLQNAAKFAGRGAATRVAIEVDAANQHAVLRVADTGVGMAPDLLARLFQPFAQAELTLDRSQGGLGLGLSVVQGLVELHGGDVAAHSAGLGRGAELVVRLPLASRETPPPSGAPTAEPRRRRRALVIEDNVDAADSLRQVLEFGEHDVEVAHSGAEGLAKARALHPHIVLCDIGLPRMNGYDVARAFRADEALRGTFLVALSGYALPEDLQRAVDAGFDRHLAKPPSMEAIEELLAESSRRSPG